jgi:phage terminase large subunit
VKQYTADQALIEMIKYYIPRPIEYVKEQIGVTPDPHQAEVLQSVADNPMTSVRSGHGVGKSALEAWSLKWFMFTRPFPKIPCTAPTKHQLYDILWAEVAKWNQISKDKDLFEWTYERFYMKTCPENWFAAPRTATKPDALQGFHANHLMFIIDEASGVDDIVFEPVLGALSTPGAKLLMCGNPTNLVGFFYDSHTKNRDIYKTFRIDGRTSPLVSKDFVKMIIDMYGEDSDVFRVRVAGDFPKALPDALIPMDWCERNSFREKEVNAEIAKQIVHHADIGVDVARFGDDESVLATLLNRRYGEPLEKYYHNKTTEICGRVIMIVNRLNADYGLEKIYELKQDIDNGEIVDQLPVGDGEIHIKIDCDGLGVGVYDQFYEYVEKKQELGEWLNVTAFEVHFGGKGGKINDNDPVEFYNKASLMWGNLREMLRTNVLMMTYDDKLISQASTRKYKINSDGEIEIEKKEQMKKRGLKSPDCADAYVLAAATKEIAMGERPRIRVINAD